MQVLRRSDKRWVEVCEHFRFVNCDILDSELAVPQLTSRRQHPSGPVVLTIRIHFALNFADSKRGTVRPLVMWIISGICYVQDANMDWFRVSDWNFTTQTEFAHKFKKSQDFWDRKFMLFPAQSCADFDYELTINGKVERWRPNILCRFELVGGPIPNPCEELIKKPGDLPVHLLIDVVRSEGPFVNRGYNFRSDSRLYDAHHVERDSRVLWHELGHAMDQDHVYSLARDQVHHNEGPEMDRNHIQSLSNGVNTCSNNSPDNGQAYCYVSPPWMPSNVMGGGTRIALENAKTWRALINEHLPGPMREFIVSTDIARPPRLISVRPDTPLPPP